MRETVSERAQLLSRAGAETAAMLSQEADERVTRLLERHQAVLASPDSCQRLAQRLTTGQRSAGRLRRAAGIAWRLLLLYAFCSVSLSCLENTFPLASKQWRTGRALSYLNLLHLKSYRWLTVQLGFYRSEFLHGRDRESCLLPNPLYRPPTMCCDCHWPQGQETAVARVRLNSPAGRDAFRRAVDSHVTPFLVTDSGHRPVAYAELRRTVLDAWDSVNSGSNRISVQWPADGVGPATLSELLLPPAERPPPARLTVWTYGHMSAIRAVRRLVPRPPFVRPDVDYGFARAFYLLGGAAGEAAALGDLAEFQGAAVLLGLHGGLRVTLAAKAECCPSNGHGNNASVVLLPGQALVVPVQCYQLHAARESVSDDDGYAMVHLFSVFSSTGIKQAAPITGRVPETDDVTEDY